MPVLLLAAVLSANPSDAYVTERVPTPDGVVLEAGALCRLPGDRLAVSTRRGEVWVLNGLSGDPSEMAWTRFAHGLHEVLSLAWRDGWLYVTQRPDVSRLKDQDGDGVADVYEVFAEPWGITGDYHEYAFASKFLPAGTPHADELWVTLCLTGSFDSKAKWRGWAIAISPDGSSRPVVSGIRSPGGVGVNGAGDVFYSDNQGPWNGTCAVKHLRAGKFVGHPGGNGWYEESEAKAVMGERPADPNSESRLMTEAARIPEFEPPAVLFPYDKMGKSTSGITFDTGKTFGPWTNPDGSGQAYVGDQSGSVVMRMCLEKVADAAGDEHYQGACLPFLSGYRSGVLSAELANGTDLFVYGTNRGWGSVGPEQFALERTRFTGEVPFDINYVSARPDGFEFVFTRPVDETALAVSSYELNAYTYIYQSSYGSPEVDHWTPELASIERTGPDRVRLRLKGTKPGFLYEMKALGVRSTDADEPWHGTAYYTLNYVPQ